jgi:hypothetical protein
MRLMPGLAYSRWLDLSSASLLLHTSPVMPLDVLLSPRSV